MNTEEIAKICHEVNKAYCEGIGDYSQKSWDECEKWQRESAIKGVEFAIENPNVTPADLHTNWMCDKITEGWSYGETKDAEKKTHPCLVEYHKLPHEQKVKDHLFQAVVKGAENE